MTHKIKLPRDQQVRMENTLKELQALREDQFIEKMEDGSVLFDFASTPGAPIADLLDLILGKAGDKGEELFESLCFANLRRNDTLCKQVSLGHLIADFQNKRDFTHFLELVCQYFPKKLKELLMTSMKGDRYHLSVLSLLAMRKRSSLILDCFQRLNTHCPGDLGAVITKNQSFMYEHSPVKGPQTLLLAFYMDATSLSALLKMIADNSPKKFAALLTYFGKDFSGEYLSQMLARKNNSIAFNEFLDLVVEHAPEVLPSLLNSNDVDCCGLAYRVWQMGNSSSLIKLIDVVISHAPASLNSMLMAAKNPGSFRDDYSLISLLCNRHYSAMGNIIFNIIDSSIPLDQKVWKELRRHQTKVLDYMNTLPPKERKEAISQCFKKDSFWSAYFDIQNNYFCSIFHHSLNVKRRLQTMQKDADLALEEANTLTLH